jgi:hypothetical protein
VQREPGVLVRVRGQAANGFDYLMELLRHAEELKQNLSEWMPWN